MSNLPTQGVLFFTAKLILNVNKSIEQENTVHWNCLSANSKGVITRANQVSKTVN